MTDAHISNEIPDDWRDRSVQEDGGLGADEKETSITIPNDEDMCTIHTDVATMMKWIQSVEESKARRIRVDDSGNIIGVTARIPKSIIKLQGNSRKSTAHSQMVSYGPLME